MGRLEGNRWCMNGGSDFRPLRTGAANRTALLEKLNQGREGRVQIKEEVVQG